MAGNRTLKLSILADVDNLRKGLNQADNDIQGFGGKIEKFGKIAGAAFLAAGAAAAAYAGKLAIDGVKAAIEDEAAQLRLATSLKNVTGATDATIASTEDYITKTSLATGVTDDELRPSLDRLVRATKDVTEAQKLQTLALDIAAGTGKDLGAVSEALGKAYDGNFGALKKLGVSIDESIIKSKDFDAATRVLATTFKDQANLQADTFDGKIRRLNVAFAEGKETVGAFILDAITPLIEIVVEKVIPAISDFSSNIGDNLGPVFSNFFGIVKAIAIPIIEGLKAAFDTVSAAVSKNRDGLSDAKTLFEDVFAFVKNYLAPVLGTVLKFALMAVGDVLAGLITGFSKLASFISSVVERIKDLIALVKSNPLIKGIGSVIDNVFGGGRAAGGPVTGGTTYLVGEKGPELFTPGSSGTIIPNGVGGASTTINLVVNGAIDPEGTARTIVDVLNRATARGGSGAGAFAY
jgi:hypothetical protein